MGYELSHCFVICPVACPSLIPRTAPASSHIPGLPASSPGSTSRDRLYWPTDLLQGLSSEGRQDEAGLVDLRVVVSAELVLLLGGPGPQGLLDVAARLLAADHEANLARGVRGDRGVRVLRDGEDLAALLLELGDERHVQPLVLSCVGQ